MSVCVGGGMGGGVGGGGVASRDVGRFVAVCFMPCRPSKA